MTDPEAAPATRRETFDQIKARIIRLAEESPGQALADHLRPERERAERPLRAYIEYADALGIDRETAQRILTSHPTYAQARLALTTISFAAAMDSRPVQSETDR